jgi:hypothetical protein
MLSGIAIVVLLVSQAAGSVPPLLDLTGRGLSCGGGSGFVSGASSDVPGSPRPSATWGVTLRSLDKQSYRAGEEFVYEVEITNISVSEQWIPWSIDPAFCGPAIGNGAPVVRFVIGAMLRSSHPRQPLGALMSGVTMAGSRASEGSMLRLPPGGTAIVRANGRWSVLYPNVPVPEVAAVAGQVKIERPDRSETVVSTNSISASTLK